MLNSSNLYNSEWLALVFKNRNQQYGAFVLRRQSDHIVAKSLFIAAAIFVLSFIAPSLFSKEKIATVVDDEIYKIVDVTTVMPIEKVEPLKEKAELPKAAAPKEIAKSVNLSSNVIVVDKNLVADPPKSKALVDAVISNVTQDGLSGPQNAALVANGDGNGTGIDGKVSGAGDSNEIYNVSGLEAYPEFPGGMNAWAKFLQNNLRYPYMAQDNNIQGKVLVSFVVEKDGSITDVSVVRGIGYGCDEEAIRVIKKSLRWKPGFQNNKPVRVRYNMPINYMMQ